MRTTISALSLAFLLVGFAWAQKAIEVSEAGKDTFSAELPAGTKILMHVCSSDLKVSGGDESSVKVHFWAKDTEKIKNMRVSLRTREKRASLRIHGCPHNDFKIEVQLPKNTDLYLRMFAGDLDVQGITGDKNIEIHAGDMTVAVGKPEDYGHVDASVSAGDLSAKPFGVSKDGLFRSFNKDGNGQYRLHAHVGAGDLTLRQ
jgi:hypothetical protein